MLSRVIPRTRFVRSAFIPVSRRILPLPLLRSYSSDTLPIAKYHELADHTLEVLLEGFENLAEDIPEVDCDLAQGVFTLILPPIGTYVINKQPPNKQIWLSSPLSGPKRYDYVEGKWVYLRDNSTLGNLLRDETKTITDVKGCPELNVDELD